MKSIKYTLPALGLLVVLLVSQEVSQGAWLAYADQNTDGSIKIGQSIQSFSETGQRVAANNGVQGGGPSVLTTSLFSANDTYFDRQWSLAKIRLTEPTQSEQEGNSPVLVAVLDTGIDKNHEDLKDKVVAEINFSSSPTADDLNGHGTFVAGIIGAITNNGIGIAGIAPNSRLLNVKVADDEGYCKDSSVVQGIIWAADHGARVINLSLELDRGSTELESAVNYAWQKGAVVIAVASNQSLEPVYPAYYKNSLAVVATDQKDAEGPLSGYGDWVDVTAPGVTIYSTLPDNSYGYKSGTSFAVAHVSGLAALLFCSGQNAVSTAGLNVQVRSCIENGALDIGPKSIKRIDAVNSILLMNQLLLENN